MRRRPTSTMDADCRYCRRLQRAEKSAPDKNPTADKAFAFCNGIGGYRPRIGPGNPTKDTTCFREWVALDRLSHNGVLGNGSFQRDPKCLSGSRRIAIARLAPD